MAETHFRAAAPVLLHWFQSYNVCPFCPAVQCAKKQQAKESLGTVPSFSFPKASLGQGASPRSIPQTSGDKSILQRGAAGNSQDLLVDDDDPFGLNALQEAFDEAAISKAQVSTLSCAKRVT